MRSNDELLVAARKIRRGATGFASRARAERKGVLSLNQTSVLGVLARQETITPGEVAHRLRTQPQSLTRTFAVAEEQGWVRRVPDPSDGRQSLLIITAAGRQVLADEMRPRDEWLAGVLERELTRTERELLVVASELLERLAEVDNAVAPVEARVSHELAQTARDLAQAARDQERPARTHPRVDA
ncbi:MAG TPA: MarR family transcriptional regulator [Jatrophihabitantaceae bacterium]|jgi:DNA-binding MarR family transcriptional regulator